LGVGTAGPDLHRSSPKALVLQLLTQLGQPAAQGVAGGLVTRMHLDGDLAVAHVDAHLHCTKVVGVELQLDPVAAVGAMQDRGNRSEYLLMRRRRG
jgi:hypothetical protein